MPLLSADADRAGELRVGVAEGAVAAALERHRPPRGALEGGGGLAIDAWAFQVQVLGGARVGGGDGVATGGGVRRRRHAAAGREAQRELARRGARGLGGRVRRELGGTDRGLPVYCRVAVAVEVVDAVRERDRECLAAHELDVGGAVHATRPKEMEV